MPSLGSRKPWARRRKVSAWQGVGKQFLFLEDGVVAGAGWRLGSSCCLKAAGNLPKLARDVRRACWLWEGSSSGEDEGKGHKPCLESEKLAQTETGMATM